MELGVEVIPVIEDDRGGEMYEPVASDDLIAGRVKNIHVVTMNPGRVRGNHFHLEQTESLCFGAGVVLYTLEEGDRRRYRFGDVKRVIVRVPPGVPHAIVNEGKRVEYVVCSSDVLHDPQKPDRVKKVVVQG